LRKIAWYELVTPLLIAIFPILSLAFENIEFIQFRSVFRSLIFSILLTSTIYLFFYLILKEPAKAGILASIFIFMLLTYGNIFISLESRFGEAIEHRYLLGLLAVLYIFITVALIFIVKNAKDLNLAIFTSGVAIVSYLLFSIGSYAYKVDNAETLFEKSIDPLPVSLSFGNNANLPDIYLFLLDGHTRSDVLKDVYNYDNSEFTNQLEAMGFWVADCSQSNYPGTNFSITSLFEMDYLHNIYQDFDDLVFPPLNKTSVFQILKNNHYITTTFHNFVFEHFNIKNDIRYAKEDNLFGSINEFEKMVVDTSILRIIIDMEGVFPKSWVSPLADDFYLTHYRDTLYALDTIPKLPEMDEPQFIYAHLLVTHDPFVFMPDGSFNNSKQLTSADYRNTVEFIDNTLPAIVEDVIRKSTEPPIIIIMGDHGASIKGNPIEERMSNLFAIYLQGEVPEDFYGEITPVNVFRLIFNYMFEAKFDLIEDISYPIWNTAELGNTNQQVTATCSP
jgi:hypothetical protein